MKKQTGANYAAWDIEYKDFFAQAPGHDQLAFLVRFAILAPSTHNSQPWKFVVGDDHIVIFPNFERALGVSDPEHRYLFVSLGCALENLLVAADYYGFATTVEYIPAAYAGAAAKISFSSINGKSPAHSPQHEEQDHLIFSIPARRSNRNKYEKRLPDQQFLEELIHFSSSEVQVNLISDDSERYKIADMLMASRLKAFSHKPFREELAGYKRTNLTRSHSGMPGFTMGFSTPLSFITAFLIRNFNVMKILGSTEERLLKKHTPVFIVVASKDDEPATRVRTGQMMQKIMLEAQRKGVQTAISAIPLDPKPLQELLRTTYRPQIFLRMGYAEAIPGHSPRFHASYIIE